VSPTGSRRRLEDPALSVRRLLGQGGATGAPEAPLRSECLRDRLAYPGGQLLPGPPRSFIVVCQSHSESLLRVFDELPGSSDALLVTGQGVAPERMTTRRLAPYARTGLAGRAISWLRFSVAASFVILTAAGRPELIVFSNPPSMPLLAALIARLRGLRLHIVVWDVYPDHLVSAGLAREGGLLVRAWRRLEAFAVRVAASQVTLSPGMAERLERNHQRGTPQILEIWIDPDDFQAVDERRPASSDDGLSIIYSGNIGATHNLTPLLDALRLVPPTVDVKLHIVGDGLGVPALRSYVREHDIRNVTFSPRLSWNDAVANMMTADLGVVALDPHLDGLSFPSKTYTYLACGLPVLAVAERDSDLGRYVEQHSLGFAGDSAQELADQLTRLARAPEEVASLSARAKRHVGQNNHPRVARDFWTQQLHQRTAAGRA
jgi:glycosyltransferase involved in cell wall biosynthesis